MRRVFTTGQVARVCRVAPRTVSKWFDSGALKGYRIPGSRDRRVPREQLIRFLKEHSMPLGDLEVEEEHRVLLVAVDRVTRDGLMNLLPEDAGYRFESAEITYRAGELMHSFGPKSVVVDMMIGRGEAKAMATSVRNSETRSGVLMIAIVGDDETADAEILRSGFDVLLRRPGHCRSAAERISEFAEALWD